MVAIEEIPVTDEVIVELSRLLALAEKRDKKRGVIYPSMPTPRRGSYLIAPYPFETFNLVAETAKSPKSCLHKYFAWEGAEEETDHYFEAYMLVMWRAAIRALEDRDKNPEFLAQLKRLHAWCGGGAACLAEWSDGDVVGVL
jgi:hypothetical protein